jgi:hypothetical protein
VAQLPWIWGSLALIDHSNSGSINRTTGEGDNTGYRFATIYLRGRKIVQRLSSHPAASSMLVFAPTTRLTIRYQHV